MAAPQSSVHTGDPVSALDSAQLILASYCLSHKAAGHNLTIERLRYPGSVLRVRVSPFCLPIFADVSTFPVISTRFPAVNHGLHVKDKRVRVFSVYYLWAV
jgi:hypothetical protein